MAKNYNKNDLTSGQKVAIKFILNEVAKRFYEDIELNRSLVNGTTEDVLINAFTGEVVDLSATSEEYKDGYNECCDTLTDCIQEIVEDITEELNL